MRPAGTRPVDEHVVTRTRQVEVFREYVSRVAPWIAVTLIGAAPAPEVAIPSIVAIALTVADIVPVPHCTLDSPQTRDPASLAACFCRV